jgi:hypothetical protein
VIAVTGLAAALYLWPTSADLEIEHIHEDLPDQDPHLQEGTPRGRHRHSHAILIDRLHPEWPHPR